MMKLKLTALTLFLIAVTGIFLGTILNKNTNRITNHKGFTRSDIILTNYNINDIGTVDFNSDGNLDIYTVNHSAEQNLLAGTGDGTFNEQFSDSGLEQSTGFPGAGNIDKKPKRDHAGIYIYRENRILVVDNKNITESPNFQATLEVGWPLRVLDCKKCQYSLKESKNPQGLVESTLEFSIEAYGVIKINGIEDIEELPHKINADLRTPLKNIFIGYNHINPESHAFQIDWRDRHGMAWTDINNDGEIDVYISRGGVKGKAALLSEKIEDELFVQTVDGRFVRNTEIFGDLRHDCPSRNTQWVDINADQRLDLYIVCGRDNSEPHSNRVILRNSPLQLSDDFAKKNDLDFDFLSQISWFDYDFDTDLDLLAVEGSRIILYKNNSGSYQAIDIDTINAARVQNLTHSDFDNDGDIDVFISSRINNVLLINNAGVFEARDPTDFGLPETSGSANWVDFDNDTLVDLHTLPDGLFIQAPNGRFSTTGLLSYDQPEKMKNTICNWFDSNNDGFRDVLCSIELRPHRLESGTRRHVFKDPGYSYWRSYLFRNETTVNNWLAINLLGPENNKQGIGSRVEVNGNGRKFIFQTGGADGSKFSHGHYRNYFGLGTIEEPVDIEVHWPNGTVQIEKEVSVNQTINITYIANQ